MNSNNQRQTTADDPDRLYCRTCDQFIGAADEHGWSRIEDHVAEAHPNWDDEYHVYPVAPGEDPEAAWRAENA